VYEPTDDTDWLLYELGGKHRAQVLSTVAAIGLPDQLQQLGCASVGRLAELLGSDPADLESLMRAATGMGCLLEEPPGNFRLTTRGRKLCSDALGSFAAYLGSKTQWDPWSRFRDGLRDGMCTTPFHRTFGQELYAHLQQDPAASAEYDRAIDAFTRYEVAQVIARFDFADRRCLVDVGGGRGTLVRELLAAAPNARGILFDLPHVIDAATADLPANVQPVAGDFFEAVPSGGDVYLVKHVLHNWSDAAAKQLLENCRSAKADGGIVVVIDALLSPGNRPDLARMLDLEMRVLCGGRERRKPEMRRLLRSAGLTLLRAEELTPLSWLFVAN
jgi:SAM-dependent methyltransferase